MLDHRRTRSGQRDLAKSRTRLAGQGQDGGEQDADMRGDYKDADGNRFREVKSIRGGGKRATRWVKVTREGEARPKRDQEEQREGGDTGNENKGEEETTNTNNDAKEEGESNQDNQAENTKEQKAKTRGTGVRDGCNRPAITNEREKEKKEHTDKSDTGYNKFVRRAGNETGGGNKLKNTIKGKEKERENIKGPSNPHTAEKRRTALQEEGEKTKNGNKGVKDLKKEEGSDKEERDTLNPELQGRAKEDQTLRPASPSSTASTASGRAYRASTRGAASTGPKPGPGSRTRTSTGRKATSRNPGPWGARRRRTRGRAT